MKTNWKQIRENAEPAMQAFIKTPSPSNRAAVLAAYLPAMQAIATIEGRKNNRRRESADLLGTVYRSFVAALITWREDGGASYLTWATSKAKLDCLNAIKKEMLAARREQCREKLPVTPVRDASRDLEVDYEAAIESLKPTWREAFRGRVAGESSTETGARVGAGNKNVQARVDRAREKLREILVDYCPNVQ